MDTIKLHVFNVDKKVVTRNSDPDYVDIIGIELDEDDFDMPMFFPKTLAEQLDYEDAIRQLKEKYRAN